MISAVVDGSIETLGGYKESKEGEGTSPIWMSSSASQAIPSSTTALTSNILPCPLPCLPSPSPVSMGTSLITSTKLEAISVMALSLGGIAVLILIVLWIQMCLTQTLPRSEMVPNRFRL